MRLVWKLLRQHISFSQLAGFFFANLCGMVIVLLSVQFYKDVLPVFTEGDSFMKKDYVIVSKKVSTLGSFVGKSKTFSEQDIAEISVTDMEGTELYEKMMEGSSEIGIRIKGLIEIRLKKSEKEFVVPDNIEEFDIRNYV